MYRATGETDKESDGWQLAVAAYCLHFAYHNFCRIHKMLRITLAMAAGITAQVWELRDLLSF